MPDSPPRDLTLVGHLEELRTRILWTLGWFVLAFGVAYHRVDLLLRLVRYPLATLRPDLKLAALSVTETFFVGLKLAAFAGAAGAFLPALWHTWRFVAPGLEPLERRWAGRLLIPGVFLFLLGVAGGYFVVLPTAFRFLLEVGTTDVQLVLSLGAYVDFVLVFLAALGILGQLPLLIGFLDLTGVVSADLLACHRRHCVVLAAIVGALVSPPDPISQLLIAGPIVLLIEGGIWFARLLRRQMAPTANSGRP
jgi:sec-independent protein translocase protein TatC